MSQPSDRPALVVHALLPFDRSAKVRWLLTELGVDFETRWLDRGNRENEQPDFLKLNPQGRVPVLELGGKVMFESGAICAFLADLNLDRGFAPTLDSPERMPYQQWMYFADATLGSIQTRMMIVEDIPAGPVRQDKESSLFSDYRDALTALDRGLSAGTGFLVGNRPTAADICVGYQLYFTLLWPELAEIARDVPRVTTYLDRLKERPAAIRSEALSYRE